MKINIFVLKGDLKGGGGIEVVRFFFVGYIFECMIIRRRQKALLWSKG